MNNSIKHMKYLVEFESADENPDRLKKSLDRLPFVKNVALVEKKLPEWDKFASMKCDVDMYLAKSQTHEN